MIKGRVAGALRILVDWVKSISIALVAWFLLSLIHISEPTRPY